MSKNVITYGTFDLLHTGHLNLLERAKELGDRLIVAVSTDEFNLKKHKEAIMSYEDRKRLLESLKIVDMVIPEETWEQKTSDINKYEIDVFVMGDDWQGEFDFLNKQCEVVYLPRTPKISTTEIKEKILNVNKE